MRTVRFVALMFAVCLGTSADASQEGALAWNQFRVESKGIGDSGPVVVSGEQAADGLQTLRIEAFGKTVVLDRENLEKLQGVKVNAMQLSYEAGYSSLGGRTVYVLFSMGFTSGTTQAKLVTFNEREDVRGTDVHAK